jgi:magnesium transporter
VRDIRAHVTFHGHGKRFITVGVKQECQMFDTFEEWLRYISPFINNKERNSISFQESVWIDVNCPSSEELKRMEKLFLFHPLTTEDIESTNTTEKWDTFTNYTYVVLIGPLDDSPLFPSLKERGRKNETLIHLLLFHNCVLTIHYAPLKGFDILLKRIEMQSNMEDYDSHKITREHSYSYQRDGYIYESIRKKQLVQNNLLVFDDLYSNKETLILSPDWILYAFLDVLVDLYIPYVDSLLYETDKLDESVYSAERHKSIHILAHVRWIKHNITTLKRLLVPKCSIATHLASGKNAEHFTENIRIYIRDVLDHLHQCMEKLDIIQKTLNDAQSNFVTRFQIERAKSGRATQTFTNQMTLVAGIWGIGSLIAGLWGMNIHVPGQSTSGLYWFHGITSFLVLVALLLVIYFWNELVPDVKQKQLALIKVYSEWIQDDKSIRFKNKKM